MLATLSLALTLLLNEINLCPLISCGSISKVKPIREYSKESFASTALFII